MAGETYLGLAVHRAARICAAAHGGQVLLSQATHALLEDEEEEFAGLSLRDLGEHGLKDFERPVRLYQLVMPDLQTAFPPLRATESEAPFAGREAGLAEAVEAAVSRPLWRWRLLVLALATALVAGLAVLVGVLATGSSSGGRPVTVVSNSIAVIDPRTDKVVADTPVGSPGGLRDRFRRSTASRRAIGSAR